MGRGTVEQRAGPLFHDARRRALHVQGERSRKHIAKLFALVAIEAANFLEVARLDICNQRKQMG